MNIHVHDIRMRSGYIILLVLLFFPLTLVAQEDIPFVTIVDEDFSGLTEGSEENPSDVSLLDEQGWVMDASVWKPIADDCAPGWGGDRVYSAGGCIAIKGGFLNTPTGNYSGNLRATFRMRLMDDEPMTEASLDLLLCRRSKLVDYTRKPVLLTHEWKTYTLEAINGWYSDCMIQLFAMEDINFLVDDIKIEHQITSIEPPVATDPYELKDDGFTAYWTGTRDADEYLLSVYSKTEDPNSARWNMGERKVLQNDGDCVETPRSDVGLTQCSITAKIEDNGQLGKATGYLNVYAYTDYGWFLWVYFPVESSRGLAGGETDLTGAMGAFDHIYKIKVEYENPNNDKCQIVLDDIMTYAPGTFRKNYVFEDKLMEGGKDATEFEVSGLDPDTDYYYSVKARNDRFTSDSSNEMEVFDVSNPEALPATNVTANRYTANWNSHKKVDFFRIDQLRQLTVEQDDPEYVIIEEGFDGVHSQYGTPEMPEYGDYTTDYYSIDQYTSNGGWTASSPQFAEGMIGGMAKEDGYIAGCIASPQLDLSHNNGQCEVTIRAWGYQGDWLVVQGNNSLNYAGVNFEKTGWVETTVQLPMCTDEERLYFYSNNYYPFMIDNIKITQSLKAGEVVTLVDKSLEAGADERSVAVENVNFSNAGSDMLYKVMALRYYHGNKKNIWQSPYSETISVKGSADGIVKTERDEHSGLVYDIAGRRREAGYRGVQIVERNGKYVKVIK